MKDRLRYMDDSKCVTNSCEAILACNCCTPTYRRIDEIVYHAKEYVSTLSDDHNQFLKKIGRKNKVSLISKLSYYIWALESEMELLYRDIKSCLKDSKLCALIEKLQALLPISCYPKKRRDDIKNTSELEGWISQNTGCYSFDSYSKYLYNICERFDIKVERESIVKGTPLCDFSIGIFRQVIPNTLVYSLKASPINCNVSADITKVSQPKCDLSFDMKTLQECEYKHSLLVEEYDCKMTAATYVELIKCGLSHDFIHQSYKCGFDVCLIDQKTKCEVQYQDYVQPVCCDVSYSDQLQQNDVCISQNSVTYNVSSINFH